MKRNDVVLIAALVLLALMVFTGVKLYSRFSTDEPEAVVYLNGEEKGRYPLSHNITIEVRQDNGAYNIFQIKNGKADITEASCPDKVCVNHRPVSRQGESLICLPNQVVVEIENGEKTKIDADTN
ncbi:NusG domain II-containing protein [Lachnospiraceae bacterium]|nr:NusG domain II-containing protein [Lachnospiraceae bacterium]